MRVETKKVYYCDFCRKHGLRSIAKHERHCLRNPDRECRWMHWWQGDRAESHLKEGQLRTLIEWARKTDEEGGFAAEEIDWLREQVDGCPACMLAVFLQGCEGHDWRLSFHFDKEKQRFNEEQSKAEYEREARSAIYG